MGNGGEQVVTIYMREPKILMILFQLELLYSVKLHGKIINSFWQDSAVM